MNKRNAIFGQIGFIPLLTLVLIQPAVFAINNGGQGSAYTAQQMRLIATTGSSLGPLPSLQTYKDAEAVILCSENFTLEERARFASASQRSFYKPTGSNSVTVTAFYEDHPHKYSFKAFIRNSNNSIIAAKDTTSIRGFNFSMAAATDPSPAVLAIAPDAKFCIQTSVNLGGMDMVEAQQEI